HNSGVNSGVSADVDVDDENLNLARIERMAIELALRKTGGSRRDAARLLGISERTLYRKIEEYGLR
ncbi:MAG: helix-turn-helix domain-containing protein, partial [Candidatus Kapaibacteriota bacterium]